VIAGLLGGCSWKSTTNSPDTQAWFIESWDEPVLTAKYDGNTYKAKCNQRVEMNPATKEEVHRSFCYLAISLVGLSIPPGLNASRKDPTIPFQSADGRFVEMSFCGRSLCLESHQGRGTDAPWTQEEYTISSVARDRQ